MKKYIMFVGVLVLLFSSIGYAVEICCIGNGGGYSLGNDFQCGPHSKGNGNCTWYARYKRPEVDGICTGNASQWYDQAKNGGLGVGQTPVVGSIAAFSSWMIVDGVNQNVGHVAYVESINTNGSFNVSEMGWNTWDCVHYSTWIKTSLGGLLGFIYPAATLKYEFTFPLGTSDGMTANNSLTEAPLSSPAGEWQLRVVGFSPAVDSPAYGPGLIAKNIKIEFSAKVVAGASPVSEGKIYIKDETGS